MSKPLFSDDTYMRGVFDAMPAFLFVVDHDVRIMYFNAMVKKALGLDLDDAYGKRGGEALSCVHSYETTAGCGRSPVCDDCSIRTAVYSAIQGAKISRKTACLETTLSGKNQTLNFLVTASPLRYREKTYVLMLLEQDSGHVDL